MNLKEKREELRVDAIKKFYSIAGTVEDNLVRIFNEIDKQDNDFVSLLREEILKEWCDCNKSCQWVEDKLNKLSGYFK